MRTFRVTVNGQVYEVAVEEVNAAAAPAAPAPIAKPAASPPVEAPVATPPKPAPEPIVIPDGVPVKSPMPGTILRMDVSAGQSVKKGQVMCILEAMKMENEIMAPNDAIVLGVAVQAGASVQPGDVLLTLDQ